MSVTVTVTTHSKEVGSIFLKLDIFVLSVLRVNSVALGLLFASVFGNAYSDVLSTITTTSPVERFAMSVSTYSVV